MSQIRTAPSQARLCRDCTNLVTADVRCPLCGKATEPHPRATLTEEYCQDCAKGPFPAANLHLVTWNENAYKQFSDEEDADVAVICVDCQNAEEEA